MSVFQGLSYAEIRERFVWKIPERFNMGVACSDAQTPTSLALIDERPDGSVREVTFGHLTELSTRFANGLRGLGVEGGDRVGVVIPQSTENAVAHLGIYKLGAIAMPLSVLFGPEALRLRLGDAGARAVVTSPESLASVEEAVAGLDARIIVVGEVAGYPSFDQVVAAGRASLDDPQTRPESPGLLIYTSGTTGPPKGALHGHGMLLGHLPGFDLMYDFFGNSDDRIWTPADWAWIGGLLDAVLPALWHGRTVVAAAREGFDPEWAVHLMTEKRVRNAFLPPTALKLMRRAEVDAGHLHLRSCMSGGESLGGEMLAWAHEELGVTINEIYGQTEANLVVGNSQKAWDIVPGSMGRPYPGHTVEIVDAQGARAPTDEIGEIAVLCPDPVMFLEYWNAPVATAEKFVGDWLLTGDLGLRDEQGYLWFRARSDDLINSAGYRIGPGEIEESLLTHEDVAMAAVVGVPDAIRGQAIKAFVQLVPGCQPTSEREAQLKEFVRTRLSAHEYPRLIEFVDEIPMTTTGKVQRNVLRRRAAAP